MKKIQSVLPELMVLGTREVTVFTEGISIGAAFEGWGKSSPRKSLLNWKQLRKDISGSQSCKNREVKSVCCMN